MTDENSLAPEELQRLEDLLDLFITPGWRHIIDDFTDVRTGLDSIYGIDTEAQLHRNKGKLEVLDVLLSYEDTVRRILDEEAV